MMKHLRPATLGLALAVAWGAGIAGAQPRPIKNIGNDIQYFVQGVGWVWTSPVRGDQRGWLVVAATGAAFALALPLDEPLDEWVLKDTTRALFRALKPFRKGGDFYGGSFMGPIAIGAYAVGVAFDKPEVRDAIVGCGASWFANSYGRKNTVYRLAGRARPSAERGNWTWLGPNYRDKVPNQEGNDSTWHYRSFPGGHISNVTACASFFSNRYEWGYVEPALFGLALAVGVGRIPDRAHWLSDQIVGAVFGYAVGKAVADRQLSRKAKRLARDQGAATAGQQSSHLIANPHEDAFRIGWQVRF